MRSGPGKEESTRVGAGLEGLLAHDGYVREGGIYRTDLSGKTQKDAVIVLVCHMGITLYLCSHLLGISPVVLTGGFFLAPTSVTVLASEERERGTAYFRCQAAGDTAHLPMGVEPVDHRGFFTAPFQG